MKKIAIYADDPVQKFIFYEDGLVYPGEKCMLENSRAPVCD